MASSTAPATTGNPVGSPSASLSTTSSLHSQPETVSPLPQSQPMQHQGASSVQAAAEALLKPKKPTMTSRLSSMLGRREPPAVANGEVKAAPIAPANGRPTPQRQTSIVKKDPPPAHYKRFWITDDGTHEHHLKVARRQEKLTDMFQSLMLGKKKGESVEDQPLSLMSNWVDIMRNEKEKLAEQKSAVNSLPQTLVQKYGKCQEVIGRGAFGIVRVAHKQDPNDSKREQLYAVKEFKQRPGESAKRYQKRLTSEFCISSSMQHPNVITTLDLLQDEKGTYCEVMEYCSGGDLYTLVLAAGQLEVAEADCFFKQLMRGVEYMHEMGVAHRDLKPENLLLTTHGSIKITDFGNGECFRMAWEKEAHMTAGLCGSAPYIAPEEYVDKEFDPRAVDVWACGIIYMAMRTGRHLWRVAQKGEDEFFDRYLEDRKEEEGYRPIEVLRRRQCRNVIYSILDPNPTRRLTAHQVLASEWVSEAKVCHAGNEGF